MFYRSDKDFMWALRSLKPLLDLGKVSIFRNLTHHLPSRGILLFTA